MRSKPRLWEWFRMSACIAACSGDEVDTHTESRSPVHERLTGRTFWDSRPERLGRQTQGFVTSTGRARARQRGGSPSPAHHAEISSASLSHFRRHPPCWPIRHPSRDREQPIPDWYWLHNGSLLFEALPRRVNNLLRDQVDLKPLPLASSNASATTSPRTS